MKKSDLNYKNYKNYKYSKKELKIFTTLFVKMFVPKINYINIPYQEFPKLIVYNVTKLCTYYPKLNICNLYNKPVDLLFAQFVFFLLFGLYLYAITKHLLKQPVKSSIQLAIKQGNNSEYVNSILDYVCKLRTVNHLFYNNSFYVSYEQRDFKITNEIYGKCYLSDDRKCILEIWSSTLTPEYIREFLDEIFNEYVNTKEQCVYKSRPSGNLSQIRFEKMIFESNVSLDKFDEANTKQIRFFIHNEKWYRRNSFPYKLGVLVHGSSRSGKTSFIKAVANECGRHVITVELTKQTTERQICSLFFEEEISVYNNINCSYIQKIPFHKRLYVFENIDKVSSKKLEFMKELLNGVLETPDRFIIFTADNIKSISPCLLSSGRIDVKIYLDKCSVDTILDMINGFYENELEISDEYRDTLKDDVLTTSEVYEILFRNITDYKGALMDLSKACNGELLNNTVPNVEKEVDKMLAEELDAELTISDSIESDLSDSDFSDKEENILTQSQFLKEVKEVKEEVEEVMKAPIKLVELFEKIENIDKNSVKLEKSVIMDDFFKGK